MSATPCIEGLSKWFPLTVYSPPMAHPFPIDISYEPLAFPMFPSYQQMERHTIDLLRKHSHHHRILVFLYTHEQCDKMARHFATDFNTIALYGGMDKTEMAQWTLFVQNNEKFIVFSTSVAETSITIPNLSLVIDFGIRCIQRNNRIVYNHCPQSNLIQRAGRTGRTCSGVVVRCMTKEEFIVRPEIDRPEYNWDLMLLLILRHGRDPYDLMPQELMIDKMIRKFRFYQLVHNHDNSLDRDRVEFVLKCPLLLKNSCFLYNYMERTQKKNDECMTALFVLSCALINQMESRMSKIYYYSSDMPISRQRLLEKLKRIFGGQDEMVFYINLVVSCLASDKPTEFSNAFSLNFRTIRQISFTATRLWKFVARNTTNTWINLVRESMSDTQLVKGIINRQTDHQVHRLTETATDKLQTCYMMDPMVPKFMLVNDLIWRNNFILQYYNCIRSPFSQICNRNRCILILSFDDEEVDQWFDPNHILPHIMTLSFSLYMFLPKAMDDFVSNLRRHVPFFLRLPPRLGS